MPSRVEPEYGSYFYSSSHSRLMRGEHLRGERKRRCRYLEETGCASVCLNSCKVPTQEFFEKDMGLALTMTPNYDDFSCQFSFGLQPKPAAEDDAFQTPCFSQCPSKRKHSAAAQRCPGASVCVL